MGMRYRGTGSPGNITVTPAEVKPGATEVDRTADGAAEEDIQAGNRTRRRRSVM